jgi:xanthine dehydrogenase accessory factor
MFMLCSINTDNSFMTHSTLQTLLQAQNWHDQGHLVALVWVLQTWGSAPRPVGSVLALRGDGMVCGSVSGGCIEDDLVHHAPHLQNTCQLREYSPDHACRMADMHNLHPHWPLQHVPWGLPCGGCLRLWVMPYADMAAQWPPLWAAWQQGHPIAVQLHMSPSQASTQLPAQLPMHLKTQCTWQTLQAPQLHQQPAAHWQLDAGCLQLRWGPDWRVLLVGAAQTTQALVPMLLALDFAVWVCDPRPEHAWVNLPQGAQWMKGMPDDAVAAMRPDARTAIVALSHDRKLDDMALLAALPSAAFYVGVMGSHRAQVERKQRLSTHFGLTDAQLAKLHGPVGLPLGGAGHMPAEIAVSVAAQLVQQRRLLLAGA